MTYDETWDAGPARRLPLAAIAVVLALAALRASTYVLYRQSSVLELRAIGTQGRDRAAAEAGHAAAVARRRARRAARHGREDAASDGTRGIAPLASRVLKSVFTVETDWGLGSGFIAWSDGEASYLLTANHVVDGQLTGDMTVSRKGGSWSGEITAVDPKHDLAVIGSARSPPARDRSGRRRARSRREPATSCCSSAARTGSTARSRPGSSAA